VERDIAIVIEEGVPAAEVTGLIKDFPSEFVSEVSVFDSYSGKGIPEGRKSLGVAVTYRSPERTLTDEEVDGIHQKIVEHLVKKTGGELRG
jgi:phenylalanyl-tRNA synthetase beta chain